MKTRIYMLVVLASAMLSGCFSCSEQMLERASSPNGKYVAQLFVRNCGATTALFYHVNFRLSEGRFSSDSRGFIDDGQVFVSRAGNMQLKWKDDKTLSIECAECQGDDYAKKFVQSWKDVNVSCSLGTNTQMQK